MKKSLYFECSSGISGDMAVAALLDLGADQKVLEKVLKSMPLEVYSIEISRVEKSGIDVCDFKVEIENNLDHDMEYLHAVRLEDIEVLQEMDVEAHSHDHRTIRDITDIIAATDMTDGAREVALKVFNILAEAEAAAHGVEISEVHFHEVGAIDSIVDIVSFAVCFDNLGIKDVVVKDITDGSGVIRCQHGLIPIPAPAAVFIASNYHIPLKLKEIEGELVTPTGIACMAAVGTTYKLPYQFTIERGGMGAGKRTYETPGIARAFIIKPYED
ncbi:MAG: LarC family nickel insertion protein [Eggerthellaceae bacterium]|nr:LarC family nickel insertion protein [Eggerthellaceae bacterium]